MNGTAVLGMVLTGALLGAAAGAQQTARQQVDHLFARWDRSGSPGCALGVVRDGRLSYSRGYGSENLDYGLPLSDTSTFYLASVSKQFTAASVALAARAGKLSLDDDVRKWIPELPDYGTTITVRELVHHTSGIRDYLGLMPLAGLYLQDVHTDQQVLELIARQKALEFTPGTKYAYSNSGYVLLAMIVKRATGQSLREFADQHIFRPLGMRHTHFHDEPLHPVPNRAVGYDRVGERQFDMDYFWNFDKVGDGGLYSTVRDLFLWDQNFYHDTLGGPGFIDMLTTSDVLPNGKKSGYGFGLMPGEYRGLKTVDHAGGFMGYRTDILRYPEQRFSVITLCNIAEANPSALNQQIAEVYLGRVMAAVPEAARAGAAPVDLSGIAATYWSATEGDVFDITVSSDTAYIAFGEQKIPLKSVARRSFRLDPSMGLAFEPAAAGQPSTLRVTRPNEPDETLDAVTYLHPIAADLQGYAGRYRSDELLATYVVAIDGDQATVQLPIGAPIPLKSPAHDVFVARSHDLPPLTIRFTRDAAGVVNGLTLGAGRIHGMPFQKQ